MLNNIRRGVTLLITLGMCAIITMSAIMIFTMSHTESQISGNIRRMVQAKTAAISGTNHFQAMNLFYEELQRRSRLAGADLLEVIPEVTLGTRTSYKVEVNLCCNLGEREFMVISTGYYKKADQVISTHVSRSLFKTVD